MRVVLTQKKLPAGPAVDYRDDPGTKAVFPSGRAALLYYVADASKTLFFVGAGGKQARIVSFIRGVSEKIRCQTTFSAASHKIY